MSPGAFTISQTRSDGALRLQLRSALLSPVAEVLFQVAVTTSPTRKAPPVPVAPLMLILASVTTGGWLSTVAFVESSVVVLIPALLVAVTETFLFVPSMDPATIV